MAPRSALLILGIQNEFLDPEIGRCIMAPTEPGKQSFIENIKSFTTNFRNYGGDVIWVRSEYNKPRDFIDPRNDETVLIISGDSSSSDSEPEHNDNNNNIGSGVGPQARFSPGKPKLINGARPPLRTDAFLAIESQHPPCKPGTLASEFHHSVVSAIVSPPDRVTVKTWFSAFKETNLLETLRGRFVSELYICGVLTNICVLATAADAAKHGFNVHVLQDCLAYRNRTAHQQALKVMADDYGVEEVRSGLLIKSWERLRLKKGDSGTGDNGSASIQLGATNLSIEQMVAMVEGLKVGGDNGSAKTTREPSEPVKEETENQKDATAPPTTTTAPPIAVDPLATAHEEDGNLLGKVVEVSDDRREKLVQQEAYVEKKGNGSGGNGEGGEEGEKNEGEKKGEKRYREHRKKKSQASNSKRDKPNPTQSGGPSGSTKFDSKSPVMGEGDSLGEGDSMLVKDILPGFLSRMAFEKLKKEVSWRTMYHRGGEVPRMVAVEGVIGDDGSFPIYRHPADESPPLLPFSPTVHLIVERVQRVLKHPVNHVLIQLYRDGNDYISEHSDKTLDIVRGSKIVNVSLGAQRTMILRIKKDAAKIKAAQLTPREQAQRKDAGPERTAQRIPLPHNSMFVLGLETNRKWLHGIRQDRRLPTLKTAEEVSHNGERISLTFRYIGTFLSANEKEIWGQGAVSKSKDDPRPVINGDDPDTEKLIEAFGSENHQSDFDWDTSYGTGFDVLHFVPQLPKLFFIRGDVHSDQVRMCLAEKGIEFRSHELEPDETNLLSYRALSPRGTTPVLVDVDREKTIVCESLAIIQYLEMFYSSKNPEKFLLPSLTDERAAFAKVLERLQESEMLHRILETDDKRAIEAELEVWNGYLLRTRGYMMGNDITLADIAVWPVLEHYIRRTGLDFQGKWDALVTWRSSMVHRESGKLLLGVPEGGDETKLTEDLEKAMAGFKLQPNEENERVCEGVNIGSEDVGNEGEVVKEA